MLIHAERCSGNRSVGLKSHPSVVRDFEGFTCSKSCELYVLVSSRACLRSRSRNGVRECLANLNLQPVNIIVSQHAACRYLVRQQITNPIV